MEDYSQKYKGEHVELALFGGEYQDGVLTAYCLLEDVPHVELNGHILVPLQNVASLHCTSRCDAPEGDWPPQRPARRRGVARSGAAGGRRRCTSAAARRARSRRSTVTCPCGPVASSRRASGGMPSTCMHDRADHAAVRDADDRVACAPACAPHDVTRRRQAARRHLRVRLALLPAGAAGEPARVALGIARLRPPRA